MEMIEDILCEMRYVISEYGVNAFGPIMFCKGNLVDRIETATKSMCDENARLKGVLKPVLECKDRT